MIRIWGWRQAIASLTPVYGAGWVEIEAGVSPFFLGRPMSGTSFSAA
jgi:hypothetical protein